MPLDVEAKAIAVINLTVYHNIMGFLLLQVFSMSDGESVLQGIPGVMVYLDDILVAGKDEEQYLNGLEVVLQ